MTGECLGKIVVYIIYILHTANMALRGESPRITLGISRLATWNSGNTRRDDLQAIMAIKPERYTG